MDVNLAAQCKVNGQQDKMLVRAGCLSHLVVAYYLGSKNVF